MEHKVVPVTGFKVVDDQAGIVEAFVSVTGAVDSVKDRIIPGAYEKTLVARTPKGVWSHNWDQPVSKTLSAEEVFPGDDRLPKKTRTGDEWPATAGALLVRTQFNVGDGENPGTQRARDAYSDVKFYGEDQEWSIGYNVPPGASKVDGKTGVRELSYIDLYEYSPVLFGAMSLTATAGVKEAQEAWKAAVEAGEAKEGQVTEVEDPPELSLAEALVVPAGTPREAATQMLQDAVTGKGQEAVTEDTPVVPPTPVATGFNEVTDDTPITTPQDPIHQVVQGHTGDSAGVDLEARPAAEVVPEVEEPKTAEFVVSLSAAGEQAMADLKTWFSGEMAKADHDAGKLIEELTERQKALMEDKANVAITAVEVDTEGKAMVTLTGSYEERQQALSRQASGIRDNFDLDGEDDWGYPRYYLTTEATFNNRVVYAAYDLNGEDPVRYFEAGYTFDGQQATLKGTREVRVEASVAAKGAERLESMRLSTALFRKAAGQEVPTPAPLDKAPAVTILPGAFEVTFTEGEKVEEMEALTEADLLLLERLKLEA